MIGAVRERIVERVITEKNFEFTGTVEAFGTNGEGIVHRGETVFFAPFTVVGEKVKLKALKVKDRIGYAKALEILTPADERVRPRCPVFTKCGGCQLQHLRYGAQLKLKSKTVKDALRKIAGIDFEIPVTVKSDHQFGYRNKLQIPVGVDANGNTVIGFYAERSHRIVPVAKCPIHPSWSEDVISIFSEYIEKCGVRGYSETEIDEFLEDIDYDTLLQAVWNNAETVYSYRADGEHEFSMDYRGTELFKQRATLLYEDMGEGFAGAVVAARSMELWLLEDMGFAIVANFYVEVGNGEYITEYRVYKGSDWTDSDLDLDLEDLVAELAAMCEPYYDHNQPIYEL